MRKQYEYRQWSAQGLDILRRYYGEMTASELQSKYFPTRTIRSIWDKAYELGLETKCPKYTKEEIDILKKYYGTMSIEDLQANYLPYRSIDSINCKASRTLSLTELRHIRYTTEEIDILKIWAGVISARKIHELYLPNKSKQSIYRKIGSLGLPQYKRNH